MNYSWEIVKFETRDQTNAEGATLSGAVVKIKWKRSGVDADGNTATVLGYTTLSAESVAAGEFVPFESLTESNVVGWLESAISAEKLTEYNNAIQEKINSKNSVERAVPWA